MKCLRHFWLEVGTTEENCKPKTGVCSYRNKAWINKYKWVLYF